MDTNQTEYVVTRWYRAPELLCDNSNYDNKIDVWSTALVYAELLLGKTLLPGRDYMDQLRRTVKLVGQPTEEEMAFLKHPAAKKAIRRMEYPGVPFARLFADQDAACIDLLQKMLKFNPEQRISVEDALAHEYLRDVREELKVCGIFAHVRHVRPQCCSCRLLESAAVVVVELGPVDETSYFCMRGCP